MYSLPEDGVLKKFLSSLKTKEENIVLGETIANVSRLESRCPTCNSKAREKNHECKALVGEEIMVRGLLAYQVLIFDEATGVARWAPRIPITKRIHFGNAKVTFLRFRRHATKKTPSSEERFFPLRTVVRLDIRS